MSDKMKIMTEQLDRLQVSWKEHQSNSAKSFLAMKVKCQGLDTACGAVNCSQNASDTQLQAKKSHFGFLFCHISS